MSRVATATPPVAGLVELDRPKLYGIPSSEIRQFGDGKRIERRRMRCQLSGDDYFTYHEIPSARMNDKDPFPTLFASSRSPATKYRQVEIVAIQHGQLDLRPVDPYRDEIAALQSEGKAGQAAVIRLQFPAPPPNVDALSLFDPGEIIGVSTTLSRLLAMGNDELTELVVRHRRGDHGIHGTGKVVLTDEQLWAPPLFSVFAQNHASIQSGSGLVRSRFSVFRPHIDEPKHEHGSPMNAPIRRQRDEWVEVMTLLSPSRPVKTLIYSSRDPVGAI